MENDSNISEAFRDLLANLEAATSAYRKFAGNSKRQGIRDPFYTTRLKDYESALDRGRKAYKELFES